ncbi:hypothetical protein Dtox_2816 [Desulfofarcimen acetoxidans DSM 771]|uniref:Lipoprotein n=1 Tax=Desulfofarcimen acetoxidans (strain ATCC 49208 / DSM 771 / KCTC 5769 / VKM B-1644 / 5575) TaxID=485916 RepID=C8W1W0_DESAS|nr:DUF4247 domain-containing protein [Desulfofarcimen acetoxidans]ACV63581.1 hypothetical protein Dtox_2816 [Desulfofarcimen acetoxidans DSM 771]
MKYINKLGVISILLFCIFLLCGCGQTVTEYIAANYSLLDAQGDTSTGIQKVYQAKNISTSQVVDQLSSIQAPNEKSEVKDDKAVLVYSDNIITIKKDDNNNQDSLVYLSNYQFVQNNTDSGFWSGYLTATVMDKIFGSMSNRAPPQTYSGNGKYRAPWDYNTSHTDNGIKKPDSSVSKPSTSSGTGSVVRKSTTGSSGSSSIDSNSKNKSSGSFSSKPRTSSGSGSVIRKSHK